MTISGFVFLGRCTLCWKMTSLNEEAKIHNDIVTFDFVENYYNMTLKTLVTLSWAVNTYTSRFFIKLDDDILFSHRKFYQICKQILERKQKESRPVHKVGQVPPPAVMFGRCWIGAKPKRDRKHKWYISKTRYPPREYPPFVAGGLYVATKTAIDAMLRQAPYVSLLPLEDVSLGLLREASGKVSLECPSKWMAEKIKRKRQTFEYFRSFYTVHTRQSDPSSMEMLWRQLNWT